MNQKQILGKLLKTHLITEPLYVNSSKECQYSAVAVVLRNKRKGLEKGRALQQIQKMLETQILLLQRVSNNKQYSGQICFPGGKIENRQSVVQTAIRETEEQTNLKLGNIDLLGVLQERFIALQQKSKTLYTYAVLFYQTEFQEVTVNREQIADYQWISLRYFLNDEIYQPIIVPFQHFLYLAAEFDAYADIQHFQWPAINVKMSKNMYGLTSNIISVFIHRLNQNLQLSLVKLISLLENPNMGSKKNNMLQLTNKLKQIQEYGLKIRDSYYKELKIIWKENSKLSSKQKQQMRKAFLKQMTTIFPYRFHHL